MNTPGSVRATELTQFEFRPGEVSAVTDRLRNLFESASSLAGSATAWLAETGRLNTIYLFHSKEFADIGLRWRSNGAEGSPNITTRSYTPASFSPSTILLHENALCEIRVYTYERAFLDRALERWSKSIRAREVLSPLYFCGYGETEPVCEFISIWPYRDIVERDVVRARAVAEKIWPPGATEGLLTQSSILARLLELARPQKYNGERIK